MFCISIMFSRSTTVIPGDLVIMSVGMVFGRYIGNESGGNFMPRWHLNGVALADTLAPNDLSCK
jgi:hypothetical protein